MGDMSWWDHLKKHIGMIPDKKNLFWMGYFLIGSGLVLSGYWLYDKDPHWWAGIVYMTGFYLFVWVMAYLLKNNP